MPNTVEDDIIRKTIVEQKKYTEKTMVLGTVDTGEPNAIWIDNGT